jgi:hypothetical protein
MGYPPLLLPRGLPGPLLGGVRISPDGVSVALMGIDGTIRTRAERRYDRDASGDTIVQALEQAADECFLDRKIIGIGVGSAGMVNSTTGTIISMHLPPGLNGLQVGDRLQDRYGVSVLVDHHPRVQALGDRWSGSAGTCRTLLPFTRAKPWASESSTKVPSSEAGMEQAGNPDTPRGSSTAHSAVAGGWAAGEPSRPWAGFDRLPQSSISPKQNRWILPR